MMTVDQPDTAERRARIAQMMERYRNARQRRLVRRAAALWRKTEARQAIAALDAPPERVH